VAASGGKSRPYKETAWDGWQLINGAPSFSQVSLASNDLAWCIDGTVGATNGKAWTLNTVTGAFVPKGPTVLEDIASASKAEVWALDTGFQIVKWNEASESWLAYPDHAVPPPPVAPVNLEATTSDGLWIVSGAGEIYRHMP
jgi:hypothetical protein